MKIGMISKNKFRKLILSKKELFEFLSFKLIDLGFIYLIFPLLSFIVIKCLPGSPFDSDYPLSPQVRNLFTQVWHLSEPTSVQMWEYWKSFLSFDFGYSLINPGKSVHSVLTASIKTSFKLGCIGILITFLGGICITITAAIKPGTWIEKVAEILASILISLPSLAVAPGLMYIFSYKLGLAPIAFLESIQSYFLPAIAISIRPMAIVYRYLKPELKMVMNSEYIRYAKAKGLKRARIILIHALPNSASVVLAFSPSLIIGIFSGVFLVENIFSIPGVATEFIHALQARDFSVMSAFFFCFVLGFYVLTLFFQILSHSFNPRLKEVCIQNIN